MAQTGRSGFRGRPRLCSLRRMKSVCAVLGLAVLVSVEAGARAQAPAPDPATTPIKSTALGSSVWMLEGVGGNIGVSGGEDGVFIIDDQFAPSVPKIRAAIAEISKQPLRFVFNTHWHGDHTGGNEQLAGAGALIIAHDNVRKRMSSEQFVEAFKRSVPASPKKALPIVTFSQEVTFHLNGDEIHVFHVDNAHTDGDAIVQFRRANVVHSGDCFVNGSYPSIDYSAGGTIDGYIAAQEKLLSIVGPATKIIPGHGPLGDKASLQAAHDMLVAVRNAVAKAARGGKTLEQVLAAKPTAAWDETWGTRTIKGDMFTAMVFKTLKASSRPKH